jgi:Ca2+-binding EF-hand superfamily protein
MKLNTLIIPALALGVTCTGLVAQDGSRLKQMDQNGDGKISQDEAPADIWEKLSKLDTDGDGAVTPKEMASARPGGPGSPGGGAFFQTADKNGDGKITEDEAGERWERMSKADKDGDGGVTREELAAAMRGAGGAVTKPNPQEFFAKMDKDGNGGITENEAPAEVWSRMSKADANADGKVTQEELKAAQAGREGARGESNGGAGQTPKRPPVES